MRELVLEELLDKVKNRFLLTVAAARRARQLKDGAKPLIDAPEGEPAVIVALDEILEDKINIEMGSSGKTALQEIDLKKLVIKEPEVIKPKAEDKKAEKADKKPAKKATTAKKPKTSSKKKKSRSMAA